MNKKFVLLNRSNNTEKSADTIVRFAIQESDYLVYSTEESEENCQIFVSKLVVNSEGKYFIDDLTAEEKSKLSNVVYNIVILTPTEAQKGASYETLANNLLTKFEVKLSLDIPDLGNQEYHSNSSVAVTSKLLVQGAVKFYQDNLNKEEVKANTEVPTWTMPEEVNVSNVLEKEKVETPVQELTENVSVSDNTNVNTNANNNVTDTNISTIDITNNDTANNTSDEVNIPNPQLEKMAVVSDPSLEAFGANVNVQPNAYKNNKTSRGGFAINKYVIIGTVCLILAIVVVVTAYILIRNMA